MLSFQPVPEDTSEEDEDDGDEVQRSQPPPSKRTHTKAGIKRRPGKAKVTNLT